MCKLLQNWLLARTLNKAIANQDGVNYKHIANIVRESRSKYKLGSCTVTNFNDDKASRDAAVANVNVVGEIRSKAWQQDITVHTVERLLGSDTISMPDNFVPPPTKVEVRNVIIVEGEDVSSPSLPNKNVHSKIGNR